MPDDLKTTRTDVNAAIHKLDDLAGLIKVRTIVTAVGIGALVVAVVVLSFIVRANTVAINRNEDERVASCRRGRQEIRDMAEAIVNGSADGLAKIGKANPRNQTPEAQAVVDLLVDSYRTGYMGTVLAAAPRPEDCGG